MLHLSKLFKALIFQFVVLFFFYSFMVYGSNNGEKGKKDKWDLVWEEQFIGNKLDTNNWSVIKTWPVQYEDASDWNRHMITDEIVYEVKKGNLYIKGINNPGHLNDPRPYLTGRVKSQGKFYFLYGCIFKIPKRRSKIVKK